MLDIHTAGAAEVHWRDSIPADCCMSSGSAGSSPGPICFGRGDQPTVTDANLILGRLDSSSFLGGLYRLTASERCALWSRRRIDWQR